ncbi:uncharacterized protein B0I36DRAFT_359494 [Microdochium trichocladiopsis]|uniref:Uncharacterized protein n=1 Tax=Microdochium trichocladiopsis TaxID=1682393 RepID=A0A9P9BSF4_9PEZI|nr:uncharacterized protein B0I36DRAFT_359494 [Microdochium trichocladiopsis]KAH7037855.1 hypothetical protein B0I36DRAFT_359494 [Microdochium trichocladiopsis]
MSSSNPSGLGRTRSLRRPAGLSTTTGSNPGTTNGSGSTGASTAAQAAGVGAGSDHRSRAGGWGGVGEISHEGACLCDGLGDGAGTGEWTHTIDDDDGHGHECAGGIGDNRRECERAGQGTVDACYNRRFWDDNNDGGDGDNHPAEVGDRDEFEDREWRCWSRRYGSRQGKVYSDDIDFGNDTAPGSSGGGPGTDDSVENRAVGFEDDDDRPRASCQRE